MALSKAVPNAADEIDLKIHYMYYNESRVSPISIEFTELMSPGYIGLEAVIQSQIKYISRMPMLRMSYKDKEGDYVDVSQANFSKFHRTVRTDEIPVVNIKVSEGTSPGHFQSPTNPRSGETTARKELNFQTPTTSTYQSECHSDGDEVLDFYTYRSPIEQTIKDLTDDIKELETESVRDYALSMLEKYCTTPRNIGNGKQCGNCHLRLDHNARQCTIEKCVTSQQCGDVSKHPEEKSIVESANEHLKRLEKKKKMREKTLEHETKQKAIDSVKNSFNQKIRGYLINSDKGKYLLKTANGHYVPRSGIVNIDTAKLEKHFHGKVPDNLEQISRTFPTIIKNFDGGRPRPRNLGNPARPILEANSVRFPAALGRPPSPNAPYPWDESVPPKKRR
ncbi:uncharacterized protein LOC133200470 [Saccostrea echinata]|uniref:uncharacterized protein LOC133200470 n=1 Tax=Saccostrea echinata TaxID=191078 RepID=UPI002A7F2CDA|nr:uncharacterized protein LOC133200470 [Saccostrea echinata]